MVLCCAQVPCPLLGHLASQCLTVTNSAAMTNWGAICADTSARLEVCLQGESLEMNWRVKRKLCCFVRECRSPLPGSAVPLWILAAVNEFCFPTALQLSGVLYLLSSPHFIDEK